MKYLLIILGLLILHSCASQKSTQNRKCDNIYKNGFSEILHEKYQTISEKDTITLNEIRFKCIGSAFYTHKTMYDKFGKWDKAIYPINNNHPILMWENVDLFENGKKYIVMTNGLEISRYIYASVMVFDTKGTDLLADSSTEKNTLTNFFADLIKQNNPEDKTFYEVYWKTVDPEHWELLKRMSK